MCGILGSINRPFDRQELNLLQHRGPDDAALTKETVGNHLVTLGHRRLSIVDLSPAGRQPMTDASGRCTIVFNGEIYNHAELRKQIPDLPYRGHSDTETIVNYLAHHGIAAADDFNGIFALAFLDSDRQKLLLARDPFGVKPLYYWYNTASFIFSSELRPLAALVDDSIDPASLAELLRLRYLPAPDTLFSNTHKVRPGHVLEVDLGTDPIRLREYPFVTRPACEAPVRSRAEALEQYGTLVEDSVRRQLMADVKIGVFLSGGVDSALVAAIAQKHCSYTIKAFTVGFKGRETADEIEDARETARITGLDHHEVRIGFSDFLGLMPRIAGIVEEPLATTSAVPMYMLSALASGHGKVMLSGQGADEAMGGYRRYLAERLRSCVPRWLVPPLKACAELTGLQNDAILRGLDSAGESGDVRRFESVYSVFGTRQILRLTGREPSRAANRIQYFYDLLQCSQYRHSVQRMMALDLRMNLADDLLLYTDKITMHHSIECRVPLLDHKLVRFAEALPCRYRVSLLGGKVLHNLYARRLLPGAVVRRKKKGFLSPTRAWFKDSDRLRDILLDPGSRFASYFDLREVDKILIEHRAGFNRERHIFLLLGLYYWFSALRSRGAERLAGVAG